MEISKKIAALLVSLILVSTLFASSVMAATSNGTPFKELWDAILGIQTDAATLQAQVDSLQDTVDSQADVIADLQAQVDALSGGSTGLATPDYDSGWVPFAISGTGIGYFYAYHGLNTRELIVYVYGRYSESGDWHQFNLNSYWDGLQRQPYGAYWYCSSADRIVVIKNPADYIWQQVRVLIWKIPEAVP
jgi:hypothetical protein